MLHRKTVGCDMHMPSVKGGRLRESYNMTCEDNEIALRFVKRSAMPDPGAGQILGRVTVLKMRFSDSIRRTRFDQG